MCGFAGIMSLERPLIRAEMIGVLNAMGNQIADRGPDDSQQYIDQSVGMIFRRLSIVDIENGAQPMSNEDKSIIIMVNGEIYNHKDLIPLLKDKHHFKSGSDIEVLLHLYEEIGINFLQHVNGMFALVIWDKRCQKLIIARDRLGIKPVYYSVNKERIIFGSEIKALMPYPDCPREYDWENALNTNGHLVSKSFAVHSYFKGIENLKAGTYLTVDLKNSQTLLNTYWELSPLSKDEYASDKRTEKQIIQGYKELLENSVMMQLMGEVDLGLFLSGGIDSVALAHIASQHQKLETYSVMCQSTFQNEDSKYSVLSAKYLNLPNHQVLFHGTGNKFNSTYWKKLLWTCETHRTFAEQLYKIELHKYAKSKNPKLKIILSGQGSDEFNGGYSNQYLSTYPEEKRNWLAFKEILSGIEKENLLNMSQGLMGYSNLLNKEFIAETLNQELFIDPWFYQTNRYAKTLQMYNLWHEDRTAASNGIENRVPFLDHRIIEYTMGIPPSKHGTLFWDKNILRMAFKGELPAHFIERPKCPFYYGKDERSTNQMMYNILMSDNETLLYESLGEPGSNHPVLNRAQIQNILNGIENDKEYKEVTTLFSLVNMGLLEKMALETKFQSPAEPEKIILSNVTIENWDEEEMEIPLRFLSLPNPIILESRISFLPGIALIEINKTWYITMNNIPEFELEEKNWIEVLKRIDGTRTLRSILLEINLPTTSSIIENLQEAIEYNLITFIS